MDPKSFQVLRKEGRKGTRGADTKEDPDLFPSPFLNIED